MRFITRIFLDACAFHPPQPSEKAATSELLDLKEKGLIIIIIPHGVNQELSRAPQQIAKLRTDHIFTISQSLNDEEENKKLEIRKLLFNNKQILKQNEINDIDHIFEAQKYGSRYFVTVDTKHILSKASQLEGRIKIKVVTPAECLMEIKKLIASHNQDSL